MKLLVLTQRVDANDTNLGFHVAWLREMASKVDSLTVIAQSVGSYDLPENVNVISLGKERGASKPMQALRLAWYVLREVPQHDAVLVLMVAMYAVIAGIPARLLGKPLYLWFTHKHVSFALKVANLFVRRIFTASSESLRLGTTKANVMGHAIDTKLFDEPGQLRAKRVPGLVMTVGRLSRSKHVETIIEAVASLAACGLSIQLEIIGEPVTDEDKVYASELAADVETRKLSHFVHFKGGMAHDQIPEAYRRAGVCVNASSTGSLDKAVLEAMATCCPVITSNEAFKDIVPPTCFVPKGDVRAMAEAICMQLEHPIEPDKLRERVVGMHGLSSTIGSMLDLIKRDLSI